METVLGNHYHLKYVPFDRDTLQLPSAMFYVRCSGGLFFDQFNRGAAVRPRAELHYTSLIVKWEPKVTKNEFIHYNIIKLSRVYTVLGGSIQKNLNR